MSDVQMNRSTNSNEEPKRKRLREQEKSNPASDPVSASPGRWLSEIIVDALLPDQTNWPEPRTPGQDAQYLSAVEILNSYRLVPRYKRLKYPTELVHYHPWEKELPATKFIVDNLLTLETKSLCFGTCEPVPEDNSPSFPMINQPGVLSGRALQEYLYRPGAPSLVSFSQMSPDEESEEEDEFEYAQEFEDESEDDESIVDNETTNDKSQTSSAKSKYEFISDDMMDAAYRTWFPDPTDGNKEILWKTLHNFFSRETNLAGKGDDLRAQGESDDFQQNLVIRFMDVLEQMVAKGKVIEQPSHYIRRMWKNCRVTALVKLTEANHTHLPIDIPSVDGDGEPSNDEEASAINRVDQEAHRSWSRGGSKVEATEDPDVVHQRRLAMLPSLSLDMQYVVGMHLAQKTQLEIGTHKGVSQQAISKQLRKASVLLQEMQNEVTL